MRPSRWAVVGLMVGPVLSNRVLAMPRMKLVWVVWARLITLSLILLVAVGAALLGRCRPGSEVASSTVDRILTGD